MQLRIPYAKSFPNMHFLGLNYDNETLIYYRSALNIHSNFFPFKMTFRGSFEAKNSAFSCQANISLTRQRMHFRQFFKVALYFTCILQKSFRDPKLERFEILSENDTQYQKPYMDFKFFMPRLFSMSCEVDKVCPNGKKQLQFQRTVFSISIFSINRLFLIPRYILCDRLIREFHESRIYEVFSEKKSLFIYSYIL